MTITNKNLAIMREKIKQVLNKANDDGEYFPVDWEFDLGRCTYNGTWAEYKLLVKLKNGDSREMYDLRMVARLRGIDINKTAKLNGRTIKLIGFRSKARKHPYIIEDVESGDTFIMSEDKIRQHFGLEFNHG
jgi:hypothetical protein